MLFLNVVFFAYSPVRDMPQSVAYKGPSTKLENNEDLSLNQNVSEVDNKHIEYEENTDEDFNSCRPPTRRAYLVSTQSSVTDDTENLAT